MWGFVSTFTQKVLRLFFVRKFVIIFVNRLKGNTRRPDGSFENVGTFEYLVTTVTMKIWFLRK
jgi:hypothetical protein